MRAIFTFVILLCFFNSWAGRKPFAPIFADGTNYDIIYHRISFSVDPGTSGAINSGSVTTYFRTTVNNVSTIQFDLDGALTVSSAKYHGNTISKSHNTTSDILTLTITPTIAVAGTLDSVTVFYSGTPTAPSTSIPSGYNYVTHNTTQKAIYTLDEAFTAHYWWPCKESLYDKIDSCTELIVTTPNGYEVSGNGVKTKVVGASTTTTTWKTFYPIATYGINFAVANYAINTSTMVTGGKTLNLYNYLYPEDNVTAYQNAMTDMKNILAMYVSVFGVDYPFVDEQYGMTECTGTWGALEVQSMTFMARGSGSGYSKSTIAHELAHQWFGDMLTTNTWQQVWLNEGFAQFCESVVYPENMLSAASAATSRSNLKAGVSTSSTIFVTDTSTADKIFIGTGTQPYDKGAMFLSMMRAWLGNTKFYLALKNYLNAPGLKYKFSHVDSLKKYMQAQSPVNMDNFFADWIYKKGRVTYTVKYQYVTNGVYIQLTSQSPTSLGAGYFDMPVPLQIKNATGLDTTITVIDRRGVLYNNVTGGTYSSNTIFYRLSQTPTIAPVFDPNSAVLATASSIAPNGTLSSLITVLPVKDIKLTAGIEGKKAKLNWSVNADEPIHSFVLERSTNNVDFSTIQTIPAVTANTNFYGGTYLDEIIANKQYYRLKIVKQDGSFVFSNIESIRYNPFSQLLIAPNPVKNELGLILPSGFNDGEVKLMIQDLSGNVIRQQTFNSNDIKISTSVRNLAQGMYSVILTNRRKERLRSNFVKQ